MSDEAVVQNVEEGSPLRGLRDGFAAYEMVQTSEYSELLDTGLIVFDTNALLNLYRYTPQARADFFSVMQAVRNQIWVPQQVAVEFWRNRESAIADFDRATTQATTAFWKAYENQITALNTWANRVSLSGAQKERLETVLKSAVENVAEKMQKLRDVDHAVVVDITADPVLAELDILLRGRVGSPLSAEAHAKALKEGQRRVAANIPPGYEDFKKPGDRQVGDYLVWEQILLRAKEISRDILIVTGDVKPDWWRTDEKKRPKGPRVELYEEALLRTEKKLRMLVPQEFLEKVRAIYSVPVQPESLTDVATVSVSRSMDIAFPAQEIYVQNEFDSRLEYDYAIFLRSMGFEVHAMPPGGPFDLRASKPSLGRSFRISFVPKYFSDQLFDRWMVGELSEFLQAADEDYRVVLVFSSDPGVRVQKLTAANNLISVWRDRVWLGTAGASSAGLAFPF
ncbi:PIN-like domain-containing protein [Lentzea flaviverrucosa]|uniref:PIN like domain-containing protein n=1 Tax=Lentzea flaviverrucosa TaxID=200379 RepID=A0A1H9XKJ1_9PSEU|nr:PIN-like domain-containing protein [Lentzea flaviverrucosa]RDI20348.1 hypothetical protein DFR72_115191 [Lentzea flaviverrucosa]SES46700.1 hypothetical protein SAMN05216195_115191 [Lentzea flaviverrucosa]